MITDDRLDQLVRASLEWQASQSAVAQPSLQTATRRLAERLEPPRTALRPGSAAVPATSSALRLIPIVLLLAAILATVVVVGSVLLRPPPPPLPGPFGFASPCGPFEHGVLLEFGGGADQPRLFPSGSLVTQTIPPEHEDESPLTRSEYVEGVVFLERRLTPRGVDLVRERVAELELTPGCRLIRARESSGTVTAATEDGPVNIGWTSQLGAGYGLLRLATPEEEAELADLAADLEHLESWLPPDAWIDPVERHVEPDRWLVFMTLSDPIGSDRGYGTVALPGGISPVSFGAELGVPLFSGRPGSSSRCGIVDRADALLLAQSIDSAGALTWIGLLPAFPEDVDCEWLAADARQSFGVEDQPLPTPNVTDDLAKIDPCSLVPEDAALAIAGGDDLRSSESWELGIPGRRCGLIDYRVHGEYRVLGERARVHLYPRSVDENAAQAIAHGILGHGAVADPIADWPALVNDCMAADLPCQWGIAVWSEPYLVLVDIDARRDVTPQAARSFVETVVGEMRRLRD